MKTNRLLLVCLFLFSFITFNSISNAQPMSGDYTVGLNLFKQVSGKDIYFQKNVRTITVQDFSEESYLKAERGENEFSEGVIINKEIQQDYYIPMLNGIKYKGSLYYEFQDEESENVSNSRGVYATINAAAADIVLRGVSGPVRLLLVDASYPSETFPIVFSAIAGASASNTVTLLPGTGVTVSVTGSIAQPIFSLDGCSYFIFDGRQNGTGSTNSFTITNNATASNSGNIRFFNGSSNNIVRYMNLVGMPSTSTTRLIEFGVSVSNPDGNSNNLITHCDLNSTRYGVYFAGTAGNYNSNNVISHCKMYNTTFSHFFSSSNSRSTVIEHNEIFHSIPSNAGNSVMQFNAGNYGTTYVRYNRIYDIQNTATSTIRGIYIFGAAEGTEWYIENNFISMTLDNGQKTTFDAISFAGATDYTMNIYYNTVRVGGNNSSGGTAGNVVSSGLFKNSSGAGAILNMKNNIFYNTRSGGNTGVVHAGANINNTGGTMNIDNNNYYSSGVNVRMTGTDYTDLTLYKAAAAPNDQNSIFKTVEFVSNTDLHLIGASNGDTDLAGTPIPGITTDIDGDTRSEAVPYMGADEAPIPIPVELSSFAANVSGNNVILSWQTATETNNSGFAIERKAHSAEGMEWEKIGFVEGKGTTTEISAYSFTDKNLSSGKYYYRLKQVDYDGTTAYSNEIEADVAVPDVFSLEQNYPNPFNPATVIKYSVPVEGMVNLAVYNMLGEKVADLVNGMNKAGVYEISFNAAHLASGVYFYRLEAGDFVSIKKMMMIK